MKRSTERILTTHTGGVEPEIAWAKLHSMAEGARPASAQLWGRHP
jgi:hypothetical protein